MEKILIYEKIPFIIATLFVLFLIIKDSLKTFGRNKTIAFFISGIIYSILRANFISFIMHLRHNLEPILPYEIHFPIIKIFGTTPVEISGWLIVSYLSFRVSSNLLKGYTIFHKIMLSSLFISACSFAIETTAIEADWWRWRVILGNSIFGRVPTMGIIDWAFVGFEFLLPFLLFTNKTANILKFLSLLIFPLHILLHLKVEIISEKFPFTFNVLFHILLPILILSLGFIFKIKSNVESFPKIPHFCIILILSTLFFYNIYFKVPTEYFLSILPLSTFLFLNKKYFTFALILLFFIASLFSKLTIPSLILIFSYFFIKFNKKIYFIFSPFLILITIGYFEGKKTIKVNKAIESFNREYNKRNWDTAYEKLKESLEIEERHPTGNFLMAEYYLKKKNDKEMAIIYYKKSLRYYQYYRDSLIQLITLYLENRNIEDAFNLWKRGLSFHMDDPVLNYLGYKIYKEKKEQEQAEKYLKIANKNSSIENFSRLHLFTILDLKGEQEAENKAWDCLKNKINLGECSFFLWEFYNSKDSQEKLNQLKKFMESLK